MDTEQVEKRVIERWDGVLKALSAEPRRRTIVALMEAPADRELSLAKEGFVEWSTDPLRVSRGPNFEEAAVVFESLQRNADRIPEPLVHGCQRLEERRRQP